MKSYFKSAVAYYFVDLVKKGYSDPVKVIISDFLETIDITKQQEKFIRETSDEDNKIINDLIILVKSQKSKKSVDLKTLNMIENGLKYLGSK